jgi:hypothetical protein
LIPAWFPTIGQAGWELEWAIELAINKATHFPGLRSFSLLEQVDTTHYASEEVSPPEALNTAFEESSIAFRGVC